MICAIHQPNFFPWLGFFNKIYRADVFVIMDDVDYPKSRTSWQKRVAIRANNEKKWINCPLVKEHGRQKIKDVMINDSICDWRDEIKKVLWSNYNRSKYYSSVIDMVEDLIDYRTNSISEYNTHTILRLCEILELKRTIVKQSDFYTEKHSTDLLVEITQKMKCDSYLCGGGAGGYQEDDLFEKNGIGLIYQKFVNRPYQQNGNGFVEGCSILDAMFCVGIEETKELIKG